MSDEPIINGFIPRPVQNLGGPSDFARIRFVIRNAHAKLHLDNNNNKNLGSGPFRAINNAGDLRGRRNYSCGGGTQITNKFGLNFSSGGVQSNCDGSGVPPSTCNVKYVYDSSDFTRFRKEQAVKRNYNDKSFGGGKRYSEFTMAH